MAQKPDGKAARTDRVTFTRGAAERIADVVRQVEAGDRDTMPWAPSPRFTPEQSGKIFRICTFTGSWSIGANKTVTFKNPPQRTVSATNLFWPIPDGPQRDCSIAREGTAWYLLVPRMYLADAATAATLTTTSLEFNTIPVVALATSSTAKFSVTPQTITPVTDVELTADALRFTRVNAGVFFETTASTVAISISTCATATT